MPRSKWIMGILTCLMMAGGVFYCLKNEASVPPLTKASGETEAFFAAENIPADGPEARTGAEESAAGGAQTEAASAEDGGDPARDWIFATEALLVNINTADAAELEKLPGIGAAKAAAILAYRQEHGPFEKPEDLMRVPGIKEATFARLKAYVTV